MSVLTDTTTVELVIPVGPTMLRRTVEYRGESRWGVTGTGMEFRTAFEAMLAIRADVERDARHPVTIEIRWVNVPADFKAPTTATAL